MKRLRLAIVLLPLLAVLLPAEGVSYRLEYRIRGGAVSRLLFFFPLRVYYEAAAAIDLKAVPLADGSAGFSFAGLPRAAYVMRTLGFSGKTMALQAVGADAEGDGFASVARELLSRWQVEAPEFADRVRKVKKFPHQLRITGPQPFHFQRDASGFYKDFSVNLEPRYRYDPAQTGIFFKVFPTLAELLKLLNHRFLPVQAVAASGAGLPSQWQGEEVDLSADLNRVAALIEKAVQSLVTVKQKFPFRMRFSAAAPQAGTLEISGEAFPDVPLWKGFMIRKVRRVVRLQGETRELLLDEFSMEIRNKKGQGGTGHLQLKRMDSKEDER